MFGAVKQVQLWPSEIIYTISALEETIERYEKALAETMRKHPGCQGPYQIALREMKESLITLKRAIA